MLFSKNGGQHGHDWRGRVKGVVAVACGIKWVNAGNPALVVVVLERLRAMSEPDALRIWRLNKLTREINPPRPGGLNTENNKTDLEAAERHLAEIDYDPGAGGPYKPVAPYHHAFHHANEKKDPTYFAMCERAVATERERDEWKRRHDGRDETLGVIMQKADKRITELTSERDEAQDKVREMEAYWIHPDKADSVGFQLYRAERLLGLEVLAKRAAEARLERARALLRRYSGGQASAITDQETAALLRELDSA